MAQLKTIGERLKYQRRHCKNWCGVIVSLSQRELAERANVYLTEKIHHQRISEMERGEINPTAAQVSALAKALGITESDLTGDYTPVEHKEAIRKYERTQEACSHASHSAMALERNEEAAHLWFSGDMLGEVNEPEFKNNAAPVTKEDVAAYEDMGRVMLAGVLIMLGACLLCLLWLWIAGRMS